ncbi:putative component of type VI protein secretion system [Chitinivorax tropicus]|uniref:Putative component of type VI protein secretion system n=1 Tax=Chitinivorax tropicus TaxID=714531 RepID=A0A840MYM0_9PROT|nr:FHA domain-containing protein [Chitinivorax tropicus]MBB5020251.1 putative component of type VI protein secretion system [Chitinivorax tropicus]
MGRLVVMRNGETLQEIELRPGQLTIGRRPDNDLRLDDPTVSGYHAKIQTIGADSFLEDLDSTNGTLANGKPIKKRYLEINDQLEIGRFQLIFQAGVINTLSGKTTILLPTLKKASLQIIGGANTGRIIELNKDSTTLGKAGLCVVILKRNITGYALQFAEGTHAPLVNGRAIKQGDAMGLKDQDVIEMGEAKMQFVETNIQSK